MRRQTALGRVRERLAMPQRKRRRKNEPSHISDTPLIIDESSFSTILSLVPYMYYVYMLVLNHVAVSCILSCDQMYNYMQHDSAVKISMHHQVQQLICVKGTIQRPRAIDST